ncbi:putative receptor-like protein kinase [Senna tora]|uniref:non-specific serine/threonine protein kinase n=1 Tax=Senna tora TaxID=362788 RepID=A0A834T3H4_9FABA|nr:putative receptor-like protein kinase [Senna tora]
MLKKISDNISKRIKGLWGREERKDKDLKGLDGKELEIFSYETLLDATSSMLQRGGFGSIFKAHQLYEENKSLEMMDSTLTDSAITEQLANCLKIGLLCTQHDPLQRPNMDNVVSMLIGNQVPMEIQIVRPRFLNGDESKGEVYNIEVETPDHMPMDEHQIQDHAQGTYEGHKNENLKEKIAAHSCQHFSYETLYGATNKFASQNVLGQGGFGLVYKGKLDDGREIAVKKSSKVSEERMKTLVREVELLSRLKHPNVVKLLGYCTEDNNFLLVYEYVPNRSLDKFLFDPQNCIIHRDIKAENILLHHKWVPKIGDFGISRLFPVDQTHVYTSAVGTWGHIAPEYLDHGHVSTKTDVYSLGVLVLQLVSGKRYSFMPPQEDNAIGLLDWVYKLFKVGRISDIMDPVLANSVVIEELENCIEIGLRCTQGDPKSRPDMEAVMFMLNGNNNHGHRELSICRPGIYGYRGHFTISFSDVTQNQGNESTEVQIDSSCDALFTRLYCSKPMAISSFVSLDGRKRRNFNVSVSSNFNILNTIKSSSSFMDRNKDSKDLQRYDTLEKIAGKDLKIFSLETLDAATNNFNECIGKGGFGAVYKGKLKNGKEIAVKKLSNATPQGIKKFHVEANVLTGLQHRNVVKLLGYCAHNNDYLLVYEFLPYSLDQFFSSSNETKQLDWTKRFGIINDIAEGLRYLHYDNRDPIVHRDIKPSNILLDQELKAKIADFGISRFFPEDRTHDTATDKIGTPGYMPLEYLHNIAYELYTNGRSLNFLDPAIADLTVTDTEQVIRCIEIALLCVQGVPTVRPDMEGVISMLTVNHGPREAPSILAPGISGYNEDRYGILMMDPMVKKVTEDLMVKKLVETRRRIRLYDLY